MTQQVPASVTEAAAPQTTAESSASALEVAITTSADGKEPITPPAPDVEKVETVGDAAPEAPAVDERRAKFTEVAERARRDRVRRQREAQEAQRARLERDRLAREVETERQERERLQQEVARRDSMEPLEYLRSRGVTADQVAAKAVEEGTPEAQLKNLRAELERERQARMEFQRERQAREDAAAAQRAREDFVREAADADQYPTLSRLAQRSPETLQREGEAVATRVHAKTGSYPSFPQILAYLEHEFSKAFTSSGTAQRETREPARAAQPGKSQTLTSKAAEKAQQPKPFEEMSREEQRAYLLSKLG